MIEFKHVYKVYQADKPVLKNINLKIDQGEFVFLTGHSGAGKSTLFKILSLQQRCSSGQVEVFNQNLNHYNFTNIHEYRRKIGLVFQDFKLITDQQIKTQLALPIEHLKLSNAKMNERIDAIISAVNLPISVKEEFPESLSGGEQQKIALARALIHQPELILADEPTGNLDKAASRFVFDLLSDLSTKKVTVLFITHDESLLNIKKHKEIQLKNGEIQ